MYLINNCNEELYVEVYRNYDDLGVYKYYIAKNSTILIARSDLIHRRHNSEIPFLIKKLEITKDSVSIKINPLDTNYWVFKEISMYQYNSCLTIYPKYFE
jgi:hypothetical protein